MKKLLALTLLLSAAFTLYAGGGKEKPKAPVVPAEPKSEIQVAPAPTLPAPTPAPPPVPRNPYFDGDGSKGTSLAILIPEGKNLSAAEAYLPTLVQGVFVGDLSKFSAISVLDRQSLEKVLTETESGIYQSAEDYSHIGEIANVGYVLTGALTKTASGFALQVQITDTASAVTKASYSGACTAGELDNFTGIKKASLDLLAQMGVELTAKGREELTGTSAQQTINGETALARGITAQKSGTTVEALSYYYQAADYDNSLTEALGRRNILSADISSGNIGANVRNDIQWREQWVNLIAEAEAYFTAHPPTVVEMVYEPTLTQGEINYQTRTAKLSFQASFRGVQTTICAIFTDLQKGLMATNRNGMYVKGGIYSDSINSWINRGADYKPGWGIEIDKKGSYNRAYQVKTALLNDHGEIIAVNDSSFGVQIRSVFKNAQMIWESQVENDQNSRSYTTALSRKIEFEVKAADIADTISIKILEVSEYRSGAYGFDGHYLGEPIRSGQNIIPIRTGAVGDSERSLDRYR